MDQQAIAHGSSVEAVFFVKTVEDAKEGELFKLKEKVKR
jgi:hypothetical protein